MCYLSHTQISSSNFPCWPWVRQMWDALEVWNNAAAAITHHFVCNTKHTFSHHVANYFIRHNLCLLCTVLAFKRMAWAGNKLLCVGDDLRRFANRRLGRNQGIAKFSLGKPGSLVMCIQQNFVDGIIQKWSEGTILKTGLLARIRWVVFLGKWETLLNPTLLCPRPVVGRQVRMAGIGWGGTNGNRSSSLVAILHPPFPPFLLFCMAGQQWENNSDQQKLRERGTSGPR